MGVVFGRWGRVSGIGGFIGCRLLMAGALALCTGCQYQTISAIQLAIHQSRLNKTGLTVLYDTPMLKITCATPEQWDRLPSQSNMIYSHQQWRSPDHQVGMGVAYMHTPFPFSAQTIIWFAKARYSENNKSKGQLLAQWTDSLGRCWFEAQNDEYHVRGYAMTHGCDAWIVYSGYRISVKPPQAEIALAAKGADSAAPMPLER
jgi:hypothetical protein